MALSRIINWTSDLLNLFDSVTVTSESKQRPEVLSTTCLRHVLQLGILSSEWLWVDLAHRDLNKPSYKFRKMNLRLNKLDLQLKEKTMSFHFTYISQLTVQ